MWRCRRIAEQNVNEKHIIQLVRNTKVGLLQRISTATNQYPINRATLTDGKMTNTNGPCDAFPSVSQPPSVEVSKNTGLPHSRQFSSRYTSLKLKEADRDTISHVWLERAFSIVRNLGAPPPAFEQSKGPNKEDVFWGHQLSRNELEKANMTIKGEYDPNSPSFGWSAMASVSTAADLGQWDLLPKKALDSGDEDVEPDLYDSVEWDGSNDPRITQSGEEQNDETNDPEEEEELDDSGLEEDEGNSAVDGEVYADYFLESEEGERCRIIKLWLKWTFHVLLYLQLKTESTLNQNIGGSKPLEADRVLHWIENF